MDLSDFQSKFQEITKSLSKAKESAEIRVMIDTLIMQNAMMLNVYEQQSKDINSLQDTISSLQATIKELQRQLGLNSQNSSKPPSTDGFKKPRTKSLRQSSGKKVGGQKAHKGSCQKIPHEPDEVKQHYPDKCLTCPHLSECKSSGSVFQCGQSRFVIDAKIETIVTEHQAMEVAHCPCSNEKLSATFPSDVKAYTQYGSTISVLATIFNTFGAVSTNRIQTIFKNLLDVTISEATILSMIDKGASLVTDTVKQIKAHIETNSDIAHADETGLNVNSQKYWVHTASTDKYTYLILHKRRGLEGVKANGAIVDYKGVVVHDCWGPYFKLDNIKHSVCCAHILRELNGVIDAEESHVWAKRFKHLLLNMKKSKEQALDSNKTELDESLLKLLLKEYDEILDYADIEFPSPKKVEGKGRGRTKKGKTRSLIERLRKLKDEVCRFVQDFTVPFDNNLAERDLRNIKTKIKVSGCFRTTEGAENYLKIMSYIGTAKKNGINAVKALKAAFDGTPDIIFGQ